MACGGDKKPVPSKAATSPAKSAPAPAPVAVAKTATEKADASGPVATGAKKGKGGRNGRPPAAPPDSAIMLAEATQPKSRTRADSISLVASIRAGINNPAWPVAGPAPIAGALLPAKRIVAFYGNPLSKRMGILGEIPYDQMLAKLDTFAAQWRTADPSTPVIAALHLIVSVAQPLPGKDNMYRQRSDPDLIEKIYAFAKARAAITILDIQTGKSTIQNELPVLIPFLSRPDVHLGIDPEFNMHGNREGRIPGSKIGSMDAREVNYAIDQLAAIVTKYHLPPKVLIIHRFTTNMLTHASQIKRDPRVQVVINMDGWGQPWHKFDTYKTCEVKEPVQFTGFKLFFHNDTKKGDAILAPHEVLALRPRPVYIQYQ
jgi:hypothetical protein